jgi:glutathione S-transferase
MTGQTNWYRHYNEVENEDALKRYVAQTYRTYDVLEGQLKKSNGGSVLEMGYAAVDMHYYPWVLQHEYAPLDISRYPMIKKWLERVGGRPEVKAAYEKIPKGEHAWTVSRKIEYSDQSYVGSIGEFLRALNVLC